MQKDRDARWQMASGGKQRPHAEQLRLRISQGNLNSTRGASSAAQALEQGADYVSIGKSALANPDWPMRM